jgi:hypothetical protein
MIWDSCSIFLLLCGINFGFVVNGCNFFAPLKTPKLKIKYRPDKIFITYLHFVIDHFHKNTSFFGTSTLERLRILNSSVYYDGKL